MTYLEIGIIALLTLVALVLVGYTVNRLRPRNLPDAQVTSPARTEDFPASIPGLNRGLLTSHLNKIGVSCGPAQYKGPFWYVTTCDGSSHGGLANIKVEVSSHEQTDRIYKVIAVVFQGGINPSDGVAIDVLGHIAAMPYTNAEPDQARAWVEHSLPLVTLESDKLTELIGGTSYWLACGAIEARCISIFREEESTKTGRRSRPK
jgi:hypothetical protein